MKSIAEQSLDPTDWASMKILAHQMIDDMFDYLQTISQKPVWQPLPSETKDFLNEKIPLEPQNPSLIYDEFRKHILPYTKGGIHPRFFALVEGTGSLLGALADMWAATMNSNVCNGENSPMYVDKQVVEWCKQIFNFPKTASGMLVSGSSMANNIALTVARNYHSNYNVREEGLSKADRQLTVYCSTETHSCIQKSVEIIGLGTNCLRKIGTDENFQLNLKELKKQIEIDLSNGCKPMCVVGNAGTVNTGAIDPLVEIHRICQKYNIWFHIDGAYGAIAKLSTKYGNKLVGVELADSIGFDLHKWMYVPYEVGCVLIKNSVAHRSTFSINPSYLSNFDRGMMSGPETTNNLGFELSRGFKALKVWMSIKEHGLKKYASMIDQNIDQAIFLADLIKEQKDLELIASQSLSIVCYRFVDKKISVSKLNFINKEILIQLQEKGIAAPSSTILNGVFWIRVCIVNHRTKMSDLETLVDESLKLGHKVVNSLLV